MNGKKCLWPLSIMSGASTQMAAVQASTPAEVARRHNTPRKKMRANGIIASSIRRQNTPLDARKEPRVFRRVLVPRL